MSSFRSPSTSHVLTVPGLHGSGAAHWQTWIEQQFPSSSRVQQRDWARPNLDEWAEAVQREIANINAARNASVVIVAHSFGCLAAAHALASSSLGVAGAMFVAPASPKRFGIDAAVLDTTLPISSIVVGSESDPWMSSQEARALAQGWRSAFINLGHCGHINIDSGFGAWEMGRELVETLIGCGTAQHRVLTGRDRHVEAANLRARPFAGGGELRQVA